MLSESSNIYLNLLRKDVSNIMSKIKILIPLDGTEKSMHSLEWLKKFYSKENAEVTLIYVTEVFYKGETIDVSSFKNFENISLQILDEAASKLEGYNVNTVKAHGHVADTILKEAKGGEYDLIIMTKSSVKGVSRIIGSVTSKVVRNSEVAVIVVPE
jgi:nucleotide-binding universal stress UspA family protein